MRLIVLTNNTLHHAAFVREVARFAPIARVLEETRGLQASFETAHPFETERDNHERTTWFEGGTPDLSDFAEVERHPSLNDTSAVASLGVLRPDIIVVFGTGKLSPAVIATCPYGIINLHGGAPESYRGLDTHLWAIYHGDFGALTTTVHRLAEDLDRGDILADLPLPLSRRMGLHELRAVNTEVCVRLVRNALEDYGRRGHFTTRPQRRAGRYYSFMPSVLKDICARRFEKHTRGLP